MHVLIGLLRTAGAPSVVLAAIGIYAIGLLFHRSAKL